MHMLAADALILGKGGGTGKNYIVLECSTYDHCFSSCVRKYVFFQCLGIATKSRTHKKFGCKISSSAGALDTDCLMTG
jgi:hypothetical protein